MESQLWLQPKNFKLHLPVEMSLWENKEIPIMLTVCQNTISSEFEVLVYSNMHVCTKTSDSF